MARSLLDRISSFNDGRYAPLLAMKYAAIAESPFRFFRGTAHLFWEDLAEMVDWKDKTSAWCCGDLHLENFGSYRAANGQVYFDINDFDEAALAPATWEVARFLVSIHAAGDTWGIGTREANELSEGFLGQYSLALKAGKAYAIEKETTSPLIRGFIEQVEQRTDDALLAKRIEQKTRKIRTDKGKAMDVSDGQRKNVLKFMDKYLREHRPGIKLHDLAIRVAGTGSLGVDRYIMLAENTGAKESFLFDLKGSHVSALALHSPIRQPKWKHEAERIVTIQRLMPYALPRFLDVVMDGKRDFILRQLQPSADKFDHASCKGKPALMAELLREMAMALASAQIRSASRFGSSGVDDLIALADKDSWRRPVVRFAERYHERLLKDHAAYKKSYDKGAFR